MNYSYPIHKKKVGRERVRRTGRGRVKKGRREKQIEIEGVDIERGTKRKSERDKK